QLRDIAPRHLSDPGNVLVACCEDGVVIRYERKAEERKIIGAWFPGNISSAAAIVSQTLVHCHMEALPLQLPPSGIKLGFFKVDPDGNRTEILAREVSFHVVIQRPQELPAPPNKPYCLLSIYNELEIQLLGELIPQDTTQLTAQPFVVRS